MRAFVDSTAAEFVAPRPGVGTQTDYTGSLLELAHAADADQSFAEAGGHAQLQTYSMS